MNNFRKKLERNTWNRSKHECQENAEKSREDEASDSSELMDPDESKVLRFA